MMYVLSPLESEVANMRQRLALLDVLEETLKSFPTFDPNALYYFMERDPVTTHPLDNLLWAINHVNPSLLPKSVP